MCGQPQIRYLGGDLKAGKLLTCKDVEESKLDHVPAIPGRTNPSDHEIIDTEDAPVLEIYLRDVGWKSG